ncbi:MAG TPA: serine/threonine protein kinase, partial [Polyangiaceae bacterium]|nr:serine/threonine protein kinase [Polyangiaceae bacterium]
MDLAPGRMVNANVRLIELLGKGGMGSVWLADHLGLEARVAVKFIAPELVGLDPSLRERFKREASICARLRSIHVVQTFDVGEMDDGSPYITMEMLEGTNLTDRVETSGPMGIHEVGKIVQQICKVLHRAHVLGIIHRDIKPDNIFLTSDSDYDLFVKVLDFGIAKQTRVGSKDVTKTGAVVGTPEFMSPEQAIASKSLDHRSDLFSLGVVAFYALTGELPFDLDADEPLWMQASRGAHIPATRLRPDLFDEIDDWFERALQGRPEHRYQSARDMANALSRIISDNTSQIMDELSASLDDSLNMPGAEAMNLRERLQQHIAGILEDRASDPRDQDAAQDADHDDEAGVPTPRMSEPQTERAAPPPGETSHPAMYDLIGGPDSEEYGGASTVWMNDQDHREAEVGAEGPPTLPRPQLAPIPLTPRRATQGMVDAVRSGAYNAGM